MLSTGKNILIIDDDDDILLSARIVLRKQFQKVVLLNNVKELENTIQNNDIQIVLLDMNFSAGNTNGQEGLDCLKRIKLLNKNIFVVVMTAYGDIDLAVKAMKMGASDFVVKPWENKKLLETILNVIKNDENKTDEADSTLNYRKDFFVGGKSKVTEDLLKVIQKVAVTDANILLLGENGTGKEIIARKIHALSNRNDKPFVSVDLGAIQETLFESEMFGHKAGAFTDAVEDRIGRFEIANKGTIFLDEIGNLSTKLQMKLLSVLQNRTVRQLGATNERMIDVRIICATNMPLHDLVQKGSFRQDLLYRINTVEIQVPALRERQKDIPDLVEYFCNYYATKYNKKGLTVDKTVIDKLLNYSFPGNVRELKHILERSVILCNKEFISLSDLQLNPVVPSSENRINLEDIEKKAIETALRKFEGNISKAAKELGLGRTTLYRKMAKYGV